MRSPIPLVSCLRLLPPAGVLRPASRGSPHEQTSASPHGKTVTITYRRPYKKGRAIFGGPGPWGQVWRLGADDGPGLQTEAELTVGTVKLAKGSYTLYVIPTDKEWTRVVNKKVKTWGAFECGQK